MTPYRKPNVANMIRESSRLMKVGGTDYKVAVPYNLTAYSQKTFFIGHVEFHVHGDRVVSNQKLPASWLVNIN